MEWICGGKTNNNNSSNKTKIREAESGHVPDFEQIAEKVDMQKNKTMVQIYREKLRQRKKNPWVSFSFSWVCFLCVSWLNACP